MPRKSERRLELGYLRANIKAGAAPLLAAETITPEDFPPIDPRSPAPPRIALAAS